MLNRFYLLTVRFPRIVLFALAAASLLAAAQLDGLRWETDARVYFPKGHPAIKYDEYVADVFGVKDSIIIAIVNEDGIYNPETLGRVARITRQVARLPGVLAQRKVDVASLATATVFTGTKDELVNLPLMEQVPTDEAGLARLRSLIQDHADLFVGNLVSEDGKATMIRVKLKEGIRNRYQSYFQVRGILMAELAGEQGGKGGWAGGNGQWPAAGKSGQWSGGGEGKWQGQGGQWGNSDWNKPLYERTTANGDHFYMAGRPVIEVTSGQNALADLKVMIPLLFFAIVAVLFLIFRTMRGVILPLLVVAVSILWTLGLMAALGVPMYTISTMLPVILVAVGIGDALHILSHYEDIVLEDGHRDRRDIVARLMTELGTPLLITTVTTAVGFLSLWWAEMPPFRVFGVFTALGIVFCWLASVTLVPALLALMKPHVSGYLQRRRSLRVHAEAGPLTRGLVGMARALTARRGVAIAVVVLMTAGIGLGVQRLYVDSSWIGDFRDDSEVVVANDLLNRKFDGTIFLNVVVDGRHKDALKSPALLKRIEALQDHVDAMADVGGSISLVDYLKSTNRSLHADDPAYDVLPDSRQAIAEYLFLLSVSGRPEQLDAVVDYDYRQANVTFAIKTDHTQRLKAIIDEVKDFAAGNFAGQGVDVHLAGSANNSYVWADLLIDSQVDAILLSKLGILLIAMLLFRSFVAGVYTVLPVTLTTVLVAGAAGWLGIPLDVSTVLAAGVAIGVGVDYTVHYLFRYAYEHRNGLDEYQAALAAMRSVGKPIVFNATVVTAGFLVLGLSQFPPHVKLGYFVSVYMVVACAAALVLLPLAFACYRPQFSRTARSLRHEPA
ncbi:MAG TPA: hypothetical protein ENK48_07425 [Gammaproteobacteria bacterium]|nr:hypothetical protein [Gammaproteobacteria bacterium]